MPERVYMNRRTGEERIHVEISRAEISDMLHHPAGSNVRVLWQLLAAADRRFTEANPVPQPTDAELEHAADEAETAAEHSRGEHEHCGATCESTLPSDGLRAFILAKGYPGTAGALDELLRRAVQQAAPPLSGPSSTPAGERLDQPGTPSPSPSSTQEEPIMSSSFEFTDHSGDTLAARLTTRGETPILAVRITEHDDHGPTTSAVAHVPVSRLEEVIAGLRELARQMGGQRAPEPRRAFDPADGLRRLADAQPETVTVRINGPSGLASLIRDIVRDADDGPTGLAVR